MQLVEFLDIVNRTLEQSCVALTLIMYERVVAALSKKHQPSIVTTQNLQCTHSASAAGSECSPVPGTSVPYAPNTPPKLLQ